jgi:uncharacterized membrane protein
MAGSQGGKRGSRNGSGPNRTSAAKRRSPERRPSDHAREALSEWRQAARYAGAALRPTDRPRLKDRLTSETGIGHRVGQVADALVSKLGTSGALASKFGAGSRVVERIRGAGSGRSGAGAASDDDASWDRDMPIPIQESMEVAVPIKTAYALCTRFADYPEFIQRIESVDDVDDSTVAFEATVRGVRRRIELEIVDERTNRRIDWEGTGALEHSGVITFHPLAPSLTHIELTVDFEPGNLIQRLTRAAHLTERAIRADMHRFKAYAELWQEDESVVDEGKPEDDEAAELDDEVDTEDDEESDDYAEDEESEPVEAG